MFKKTLAIGALALFTITLTVFATGAAAAGPTTDIAPAPAISVVAADAISKQEAEGLQFMREEEKLAHDVYVTMYKKWGLPIFNNIAAAEQKHTDAVVTLLDRYDLADPADGNGPGTFTDPKLQSLYNQLIVKGSKSAADALKVGLAIEEIDILDLQERLAETDNADIQTVYKNLLAGSENHLRAFARNLQNRTGDTYEPQYMSQTAYGAIINAASGRGGGNGGWSGRGGGRWQ
jgi:hypothetical protein